MCVCVHPRGNGMIWCDWLNFVILTINNMDGHGLSNTVHCEGLTRKTEVGAILMILAIETGIKAIYQMTLFTYKGEWTNE